MPSIKTIDFDICGDARGSLIALEKENLPFDVKRVYYIFDTKENVSRGFHAHKNLEQIAICVRGKCRFSLDDGKQKKILWLDNPKKGIYIQGLVWREMHDFSEDCVLLVLASEHYDESDYIRNYQDFKRLV